MLFRRVQFCSEQLRASIGFPSRSGFPLRAADRVEKWSPAGRSDSGKSSPLIVRLAGSMCISVGGVSLRPALLLPGG